MVNCFEDCLFPFSMSGDKHVDNDFTITVVHLYKVLLSVNVPPRSDIFIRKNLHFFLYYVFAHLHIFHGFLESMAVVFFHSHYLSVTQYCSIREGKEKNIK